MPELVFRFQKFMRKRDRLGFLARLRIVSMIVAEPLPNLLSVESSEAVVCREPRTGADEEAPFALPSREIG